MSDRIERRRLARIPCDLPVEYKFRGGRIREARMTNIAVRGLLLTIEGTVPPVGADLLFRFRLPHSTRPVQAIGCVRWAALGMAGVEFISLSLQGQDEIQTFCDRELATHEHRDVLDRILRQESDSPAESKYA